MIASRSPVAKLGIQVASPLAIVVGLYLLFAGHNNPGGGFAAGLVFGAVVTLRVLSGLQKPTFGVELIAGGTLIVAVVVAMPLLWGDTLLDQQVVSVDVPVLGTIKSGSALPFDIGVTAIVIGLVVSLLDGLSATTLAGTAGPIAPRNASADAEKVDR